MDSQEQPKQLTVTSTDRIAFFHEPLYGWMGEKGNSGIIIAFRNNGNEALFASREAAPLAWLPTTDFTPDPHCVGTLEEVKDEE